MSKCDKCGGPGEFALEDKILCADCYQEATEDENFALARKAATSGSHRDLKRLLEARKNANPV